MKKYDDGNDGKWEQQINALLDGELDKTDADQLKAAAVNDRDLARAIIEAHQLQQAIDEVGVERAPPSLTNRLYAIPREQKPKRMFSLWQPRWLTTMAAIPLAIIVLTLVQTDTPSATELAQARQELALAFAYIEKAGSVTGREIELSVGHTMADAVTGSVNRTIKSQSELYKEKEV